MYATLRNVYVVPALCVALFACASALAAPAKDEYRETIDKTYPLASGGRFTLENRNGSITIETWDKEEIHIVAEKRMRPNNGGMSWLMRMVGLKAAETASDEDAQKLFAELKVDVSGDKSNLVINTVYPQVQGVEFDVVYRITAPKRVLPNIETVNSTVKASRIEGDTVIDTTNGNIVLSEITGAVRASSTNGRLDLENIAGAVEGETTNGSVSVETRSNTPISAPISLRSTNGSVSVAVPATASFELDLRTVNGSASCDVPLETSGESSRKRLQGKAGSGGPLITLRTTNGSVHVEKMS